MSRFVLYGADDKPIVREDFREPIAFFSLDHAIGHAKERSDARTVRDSLKGDAIVWKAE